MIPKFAWREIGDVNIFELEGLFVEPWLERNQAEMTGILREHPTSGLLFNLRAVERVDRLGAQAILKTAEQAKKSCLLGHNQASYLVAEHSGSSESLPIFEKEREAVVYFARELAEGRGDTFLEKRAFPRIRTALPVELELEEEGASFFIEAAVLNLSEGGLWARFLDSKTEELACRLLDPFDFKLLKIGLALPGEGFLKMNGKVCRTQTEGTRGGGAALEFYHLVEEDRAKIKSFLFREGEKND